MLTYSLYDKIIINILGDGFMLIKLLITFIIVGLIIYFLYINGLATFTNKKALLFLGKYSMNKKEYSAAFKACTGYVKRVFVIKETKTATFTFNTELENGEIKATLNNSKGETVAVLTPENTELVCKVTTGKYFLTIDFYKAYGNCKFTYK